MTGLDFSGAAVLVTGGTRGIGAAIAQAFVAYGAQVSVCARHAPEQLPDDVHFIEADVREAEQAGTAVQAAHARHGGRLDIVVNNAGGSASVPAAQLRPDRAEAIVALNLLAPFYIAQSANALMQEQDRGGTIINIGSVAEMRPAPGIAVYSAAKTGLLGLTRALALEWGPKVRVNLLTPGLVRTAGSARHYGGEEALAAAAATVPRGRMANPDDVASACLLLASTLAGHVSGAELRVDGGGEMPGWHVAVAAREEPS